MKGAVNVFAGYQFKSEYFKRPELDDAIVFAADSAADSIPENDEIELKYNPIDITPGKIIIEELKSLINGSDICIFEASDLNNNVFIELGLALAYEKPIIILVNSSIPNKIKLPSDISGIVYVSYPDMGKLKAKLSRLLYDITLRILLSDSRSPYQDILRHFWMGHSESEVVIIGGENLQAQSPSKVDYTYYVQSGDVIALVEAPVNVVLLNNKINTISTSSNVTTHVLEASRNQPPL